MIKPSDNTIPIKTYKSILDNYNAIKTKVYTEKNIKELLIDLRIIIDLSLENFIGSPFEKDLREFKDLCNFVAHPIKDRGYIAQRINKNIDFLQQSLINPTELLQFENGKTFFDTLEVYSIDKYITFIFSSMFLVLQKVITENELGKVLKQESQGISICIMSLLQNSIINLDEKKKIKGYGKAVLILNSNQEYLTLYSTVYSDKINEQLKKSGYNPKEDSSIFLLPTVTSNITHIKVHQTSRDQPQFYETYRDSNGELNLKLI